MMNVIAVRYFTNVIFVNTAMNGITAEIMPFGFLPKSDTVKTLVLVVDNFNLRRGSKVAFKDIKPVAFKVGLGEFAKFGEQFSDTCGIFHINHSLLKLAGRDKIIEHKEPCAMVDSFDKAILAQRLFVCKEPL